MLADINWKEFKDQLNFLLQTASLNFEEANTLIKKNQLDIFSIYKLHKQITIAFMDNFTDEEIIGDFIRVFKTEKPKGDGFSIFLNWICQKQCLEKTAYNLVQFVYKNFKPDWGNDYLVQKSLIAALLRFEEFDKFRNIRASSSHITDNELNGIDFKYNVLTDGVRIGYSDELVIRKSNKRFLGMTAAVYGEKIFAEGLNLAVMSLVTAKDFPELCNKYNVNITISTTPELRADIEKACIPLKEYDVGLNIVDTHFGGETTENKQDILYQQFYKIEKEQGVFLALAPDIIYGNGVLKAIINCPEGGAVIAPHVRVSMKHVFDSMRNGEISDILNDDDRNTLLSTYSFSKWAHYYQKLWKENRTVQAKSEQFNRILKVSLNGPIIILKPAEGFFYNLVKLSKLRYNNTFLDHILQPLDHELLGYFYEKKLLHIVKNSSDFIMVESSFSHGYCSLFKNLIQIPDLPCHEKMVFSISSDS